MSNGELYPHTKSAQVLARTAACAALATMLAVAVAPQIALAQTAATTESTQLEEVLVTAQRRSEKLSEVPISITALTAETLTKTGVSDLRAMTLITPGLNFQSIGASAQPLIRGIGSTSSSVGDGSNVPIYVDGVYQPYQGSNYLRFVDVARVEVLKGPQGTLYGRNAAGGAISILTMDPSSTPSGRLGVGYARFGEMEANAYVTGPLAGDKLVANLSAQYAHSDGFRQDIYLDKKLGYVHAESVRGKLLFTPNATVSALLNVHYSRANDLTTFGNQPLNGNTALRAQVPGILIASERNTSAINITPYDVNRNVGGSLRVDVDLGWAKLTSLSALDKNKQDIFTDSDLTPASFSQTAATVHIGMVTEDLTLTSQSEGPLSYIVGASYYRESDSIFSRSYGGLRVFNANPPVTAGSNVDVDVRAASAFGELAYRLTDRLKIIGGVRYNDEKPGFVGNALVVATGALGSTIRSNPAHYTSAVPRAAIQYKLAEDVNTYASFSRGFKSGVVNPTALQVSPAKPETVNAYEVGIKAVPGGRFSIEAAAYYYDYKDMQFQAFGATSIVPILFNAASAKIHGLETSGTVLVAKGLKLRGGLAYTHGEYTDFPGAQILTPTKNAAGVEIGGNTQSIQNAKGNRLIRTPRLQANATISYTNGIANGGVLDANFTGSYTGALNYDVLGNFSQKAFTIFNANLAYTTPDGHWRGTLFGTNVFNAQPIASLLTSALATSVTYWKPATYGARIERLF